MASISAIIYLFTKLFQPTSGALTGLQLAVAGTFLAVLPAGIWLVTFYKIDRLEPEPKRYVFGVFLLGGILAIAVGQPFIHKVFDLEEWQLRNTLTTLLASIFCVGFIQEFLKYAAVRYTVFHSAEFDERVDGIIYMAAGRVRLRHGTESNIFVQCARIGCWIGSGKDGGSSACPCDFCRNHGLFLGAARFVNVSKWWLPLGCPCQRF